MASTGLRMVRMANGAMSMPGNPGSKELLYVPEWLLTSNVANDRWLLMANERLEAMAAVRVKRLLELFLERGKMEIESKMNTDRKSCTSLARMVRISFSLVLRMAPAQLDGVSVLPPGPHEGDHESALWESHGPPIDSSSWQRAEDAKPGLKDGSELKIQLIPKSHGLESSSPLA